MREYNAKQKETSTETVETVAEQTAMDDSKQKETARETLETRKRKKKKLQSQPKPDEGVQNTEVNNYKTVETVAKPTAKDDSKQKDRNSETVETRK